VRDLMENLQEIFKEFNKHLVYDEAPSKYFNSIIQSRIFENTYPLTMLGDLMSTPQSTVYHPEGNVWNHTMMVVDEAAKRKRQSEDQNAFMWAALLHDIGKAPTTVLKKERITSYDHDKVGRKLSIEFLKEFRCSENFIKKVSAIVRWHMHTLYVVKKLPFADIKGMIEEISVKEIALFSLCDRLGRGFITEEKIKNIEEDIKNFKEKCEKYLPAIVK
jgi:tRNA nucleotidyltransferase (CCA-adding enzyme)